MRTDLSSSFHAQDFYAFDNGGAGVVDAIEERLIMLAMLTSN